MSMPAKAISVEAVTTEGVVPEVVMAAEGSSLEVVPTEVPAEVPKYPRTPQPRPTLT